MRKITVKLIGFGQAQNRILSIEIDNITVSDLITEVSKIVKFDDVSIDEFIAICNNEQLYLDDKIPEECQEIELFPFASGG
ncbi:hypothetical protein QPL79_02820 [Ignisphaera sp. 4213-co]|uniref:MoaD/ThiS family protein n=1 Tax=Ignisphaera cupida TaxID=3050454 RepID=A0ABD4Z565_9CREN|nr:hypothetical protein [Ignisphaera sp. 4213-co]MDK6028295.1 hypothetical protein [Ignisphaera sp. 4213-co]